MTRPLLLLAFLTIPVLEIYVLIQVGQVIGGWWTVAALIAVAVLGSWLVRREGWRTWHALTDALTRGRLPTTEVLDAALVLAGGVLMLAPGFVSDVLGLLLILPVTRPLARRVVTWAVGRHLARAAGRLDPALFGSRTPPPRGPVIQGEVVDDERVNG
ncbi:FxsA family protein [Thermasporomyces composti]|uniref:UPF0716 protein FxsA n=1 Tax=Thermasporomyces composti TaxID=696763 RepID=A0A3D9UZN4_THECX|nr:FxsA family protein [Thermasporomyces composti]REF34646.1 UPF0716 protein FxsA [Thermasporomyces composti]